MRSHDKCKKSKKYDPDVEICVVCGWMQNVQKNKLFKMKSEISSKDDSTKPCANCGKIKFLHPYIEWDRDDEDNFTKIKECKKFIPQPKEWENHKERILEPQNHSPKSLKSKDNEPVCSDSGSDDDCSYCNGKGCVRCSARKLKDDESLSDKINKLVGSWEGLLTFDKMRLKEEILQVFKESVKKLNEYCDEGNKDNPSLIWEAVKLKIEEDLI